MTRTHSQVHATHRRYDWGIIITVIIALSSLALSGFVSYAHEREGTAVKVGVVETQQKNDGARLDRIESKLDTLVFYITGVKPVTR